jgi:hypothetical protein
LAPSREDAAISIRAALICAGVAIACLKGEARAVGDENAAIWVPAGGACSAGSRTV